ncbi:transposase [Streptomyces sp. MA15]|nr:transposase [Streptomyces sp. MA15]MDN3267162.1 transposase [Streptomyces sp. MA15]
MAGTLRRAGAADHPAGCPDGGGAGPLPPGGHRPPRRTLWRRDGGFRSTWARMGTPPPAVPRFAVVPRRWVVERTFAWLGRCRRLSKDHEYLRVCPENAVYLAMAMLLVRRLARPVH